MISSSSPASQPEKVIPRKRGTEYQSNRALLRADLSGRPGREAGPSDSVMIPSSSPASQRFAARTATSTEVLDADSNLTRARANRANAWYAWLQARAELQRAVGRPIAEPPAAG